MDEHRQIPTRHDLSDAHAWAQTAPAVPYAWFVRPDGALGIHGAGHTRRVHILANRLSVELGWDAEARRRVLTAALWHDIGRTHDGVEPEHGERSAERVLDLGLYNSLSSPTDAAIVLFAIHYHSLDDASACVAANSGPGAGALFPPYDWGPLGIVGGWLGTSLLVTPVDPDEALQALWLLKDADALDRVRLGDLEPERLRFDRSHELIGFAHDLYALI